VHLFKIITGLQSHLESLRNIEIVIKAYCIILEFSTKVFLSCILLKGYIFDVAYEHTMRLYTGDRIIVYSHLFYPESPLPVT